MKAELQAEISKLEKETIRGAEKQVLAEREQAEQRIEHLQESLPHILSGEYLDEGEVSGAVRTELQKLMTFIEDVPLILKGLESRAKQNYSAIQSPIGQLRKIEAAEQYYEHKRMYAAFKQSKREPSPGLISGLKSNATKAGLLHDYNRLTK